MRKIKFTKMHGLGNDYLYINCLEDRGMLKGVDLIGLSKKYSNRKNSIGSDGIILILPSKKADFAMKVFNADGSEAEMCGNGIRCVAKYIYDRKISGKKELAIDTGDGIKKTRIVDEKDGKAISVEVDMGIPNIKNEEIDIGGKKYNVKIVSTGNPHCIVYVDNYDFDYRELGKQIENHHKSYPG